MAEIISTEKPRYLENQIGIYSKNKIGQYSKFLDKNPMFVVYYQINEAQSTQDVGTGNIETEIGSDSPIRFNKIVDYPIYNLPELKPDVIYDETGYDIDLECTDLTALPNTIRPKSGDYFLFVIPGTIEFLFRVNNFRYNTIQSNDYYLFDADLKRVGTGLEEKYLSTQIVEEYYTIFDKIGTNDRCFLKSTEIDYINNLANLHNKCREIYKDLYYINDVNAFTFHLGYSIGCPYDMYHYDQFLEYFIGKSNIYYDKNKEKSLVLTPACKLEKNFKYIFSRSLYQAILDRNIESLAPYCYGFNTLNTLRGSAFNMMGYSSEYPIVFCENTPRDTGEPKPPIDPPVDPDTGEVDPNNPPVGELPGDNPDPPIEPEDPPVVEPEDPPIVDPDNPTDGSDDTDTSTDDDIIDPPVDDNTDTTNPDDPIEPEDPPVDPDTDPNIVIDPDQDVDPGMTVNPDPVIPYPLPPYCNCPSVDPTKPPVTTEPFPPPYSPLVYEPEVIPVYPLLMYEYFPSEFLGYLINSSLATDSYLEFIIYNYLYRIPFKIDRKMLLDEIYTVNMKNFKYTPMVIFIIGIIYDEYFTKEYSDLEYLQ